MIEQNLKNVAFISYDTTLEQTADDLLPAASNHHIQSILLLGCYYHIIPGMLCFLATNIGTSGVRALPLGVAGRAVWPLLTAFLYLLLSL